MMNKTLAALMITALLLPRPILAQQDPEAEKGRDTVLRALLDELERGKVGLELEDLERPYFIEYALLDGAVASFSASLGAITSSDHMRARQLRTDLRVGSYELDNTNFSGDTGGFYFGGFGRFGGAAIPLEDDYYAIRQAVWWATDRQYKDAVETFEQKKAFMKTKMIEDKPEDFSHEAPAVYFEDRVDPTLELSKLEDLTVKLSALFREYPDIQDSEASISAGVGNKYLVNTEGTRLRQAGTRFAISVSATAQAEDGMKLSDTMEVHVRKMDELPSLDDLTHRCREMAERLIQVAAAPTLESYTGPVLFEPEAAASIFSQQFARRFAGGQREVGSRTSPDDFEQKLGKRILPRFMDVVDDPTRETIDGQPVMGHYDYDEQGVKACPVTLVDDGRLKALVMSRNPSKQFNKSTGHGRGTYRPDASTACLIVATEEPLDAQALKAEMFEACQDEDLEFGIRIAAMGSAGGGDRYAQARRYFGGMGYGGFGSDGGNTPLVMYKVHPDGREELVRGAQIARIGLKAFKRLLAAGDTPYVLNQGFRGGGSTVVAPALLFEELDLAKIDQDFDKPPLLPTPLARE